MVAASAPTPAGIDCAAGSAIRDEPVFVVGISAAGGVCWQTPLSRPGANSHTSSVPLLGDGAAYLDADSSVFAIDVHDGHQRWRWTSGSPPVTAGYGGGNTTLGVADGRVLATGGKYPHGTVVGLDESTGAPRWTFPEPSSHGDPVATDDGGVAFNGDAGTVTRVIDDRDGATRWARPAPPAITGGGLVEVSAGATPAGADLIESAQTGGIQAIRASDGAVAWTRPGRANKVDTVGGLLLITPPPGTGGQPYDVATDAVDPATGRTLWTFGPLNPGGSNFIDTGDVLVHTQVGPGGGTYTRLDPTTGKVVWTIPVEVYTAVAVDGELVDLETTGYQVGARTLVARDPGTGVVRWRATIPPSSGGDNVFRDKLFALSGRAGSALAVLHGSDVTGFDPVTGASRWEVALPGQTVVDGDIAAGGGLLVQASGLRYAFEGH